MNQITNTGVLMSAYKFLKENLTDLTIYSVVYPSKDLPSFFLVVKPIGGFRDKGNVDVQGVIEICVYVKNFTKKDDQTQPNLPELNKLTKRVLEVLDDAVFDNTAIIATQPNLVNDPDIRYFYNSIVCDTFNIKNK